MQKINYATPLPPFLIQLIPKHFHLRSHTDAQPRRLCRPRATKLPFLASGGFL